jgi:threonine dehydrogenase-like Zn-dependent dehydrogenase
MLSKSIFGASRVHLVEPTLFRREFARRWCDEVYTVEEFFENTPRAVDVVIEASGALDNLSNVFRRLNANGRVALLARSGTPLELDAVDYMITNQIELIGSRGHLCGAFAKILSLYENGRIPIHELVTETVDGAEGLCALMAEPERVVTRNCKVLARME